jgi:hypothetical protein
VRFGDRLDPRAAVPDVDDGVTPQNRVLAGYPSMCSSSRVDQAGGVGLIDPME